MLLSGTLACMSVFYFFIILLVSCRGTVPLAPAPEHLPPQQVSPPSVADSQLWSPDQRRISALHNYLVGEYQLLKGDVRASHAAFAHAYGLDPDPFLGGKSIFTLAELGHIDEALARSQKMVLLHPKDAYLRFLHGQILARSGKLEEAQQQLQQALTLNSLHIPSYHVLIDLLMQRRQLQAALAVARTMVQEIPSAVHGWSRLSRIHLLLEQKQEALAAARRAFMMQTANPTLILIYAYLLELNGHSQEAIAMYERLYQGNPVNEGFIRHLAAWYRQLGSLSQVLALLDKLAEHTPQSSLGVDVQRVIILWELKQNALAHAILVRLLQLHPTAMRIVYLTAQSHERLGGDKAAMALYEGLRDDKELGRMARLRLAVLYRRYNQIPRAQAELHHLIDSGKTRWNFFAFLADIYDKQKNYRTALRIVEQGIREHPNTVQLIFLRGVYQEKTGDISSCMQTMRAVIALDPLHSNAYNYLGYLLAEQNTNLQEALRLVQRALKIKPGNGYYLDSLAWVYYRLGDYELALVNILQALRLHPKESVILEHYADILLKLARHAESLRAYQKALQYVDSESDRQRIENKINQLEANS